jgi:hypothetical protein
MALQDVLIENVNVEFVTTMNHAVTILGMRLASKKQSYGAIARKTAAVVTPRAQVQVSPLIAVAATLEKERAQAVVSPLIAAATTLEKERAQAVAAVAALKVGRARARVVATLEKERAQAAVAVLKVGRDRARAAASLEKGRVQAAAATVKVAAKAVIVAAGGKVF